MRGSSTRSRRYAALLGAGMLAIVSACAFAAGGAPSSPAAPRIDVDLAIAGLERAQAEHDAGRYQSASAMSDSLTEAWEGRTGLETLVDRARALAGQALEAQGLPGPAAERYGDLVRRARPGSLRDDAVERLVYLLGDTGREPEAVSITLENSGVLDEPGLDAYRQWVAALSIDRLRGFAAGVPPETIEATVVHVHLAQMLVVGREADEARRLASAALAGAIAPTERRVAEMIARADGDLTQGPVRIGAILPLTGDLANIGQLLREGMELAVAGYLRARPDGFQIELEIVDDLSDPENTADLVGALERQDVVAIIGPLRSESFAAAARARSNPRLPIISPTATEVLGPSPGAYTLYDSRTRLLDVARDLARWTINDLGLRRVAVLEPIGSGMGGAVAAFVDEIEGAGGQVVARQTYDPSLTTFREPIEALAAAAPDIVFAPAATTPVVLAIAPQLFYYGLYDAIVLGNEAWADPVALRRLERFATNYRVVGLTVDRLSSDTRWQQFVEDYERTYRKSLRDNILPALSYDAVALVIAALEGGRLPIPAALAAYLDAGPEIEGVTGRLRPQPDQSTVTRTTLIRMLFDGTFVTTDRSELLNWLAEVRAGRSPFAPRDTLPRDMIPR